MVPWEILTIINVPEPIESQSLRSADACEIQDLTPVAARPRRVGGEEQGTARPPSGRSGSRGGSTRRDARARSPRRWREIGRRRRGRRAQRVCVWRVHRMAAFARHPTGARGARRGPARRGARAYARAAVSNARVGAALSRRWTHLARVSDGRREAAALRVGCARRARPPRQAAGQNR